MESEFYNVSHDRIRYSLVWEDSKTLYAGLEIGAQDHVLVITSAGCNVLNTLLKSPATVTAIDMNPVQNRLLLFKKHIIANHSHHVFRGILGLDGKACVQESWEKVKLTLPVAGVTFWEAFFTCHPEGLMTAGKLEAYLHGFYHTLSKKLQEKLQQLIQFDDLSSQREFFLRELHASSFREQFIRYFDDANLSKGRDPKLFKYAEESGGLAFYDRLVKQVSSQLVKDNFFFRFFFFGPDQLPEQLLPPCYQKRNYLKLRDQLHKLRLVTGEAVDYLLSEAGSVINKASLSNIFEYTSRAEFEQVYTELFSDPKRKLRIIFWNLLQDQGSDTNAYDLRHKATLSEKLTRTDACFYFRNVQVKETCPVPSDNIISV